MSRHRVPVILCDGDDGLCGATATDYYEECATTVDGVRITSTTRHPGWISTQDEDYCPDHTREDQSHD